MEAQRQRERTTRKLERRWQLQHLAALAPARLFAASAAGERIGNVRAGFGGIGSAANSSSGIGSAVPCPPRVNFWRDNLQFVVQYPRVRIFGPVIDHCKH